MEKIAGYQFQPEHLALFFVLIYLEAVLSFDNAAVLAAMVRPLPPDQRRRALLYGLVGAYVFRIAAILLVAHIIENQFLKILGGLYLVYLPVKHFWPSGGTEENGARSITRVFGLSAFWSTVVWVELTDIAFALDQVLAAVALTEEIVLIIVASVVAILFLRIAASYMARIMDWFPLLESLAYVAVGFVGLKLLAEQVFGIHVDRSISLGVTFLLLVAPVIFKFVAERLRARAGAG